MKMTNFTKMFLMIISLFWMPWQSTAQEMEVIRTNADGQGNQIILTVTKGEAHNHPMMAVWIEDLNGRFLQTLYVNQSVAKGYFTYADKDKGKWLPGPTVRPAALPVWAHKRGIPSGDGHFMPTQENPVPDALTSATPAADFAVYGKADLKHTGKGKIFFEINQSWDWNEYWTNSKYPEDEDYKSSAQPSLVYSAIVDFDKPGETVALNPIGHGHYSGKDGTIYLELKTLTTALKIVNDVKVMVE